MMDRGKLTDVAAGAFLVFIMSFSPVLAKDLSIKAFTGLWQGSALSENNNSANFALTQRDMDVEIRPATDGSFTLTWRTVQRQKGSADAPTEVLKTTTRTFKKAAGANVWHASTPSDPLKGGTPSWARVKGQTLSVYSMAVSENGSYDMLVYDRTLSGLGMTLEFTAIRDGRIRRTAKGTLVRTGK